MTLLEMMKWSWNRVAAEVLKVKTVPTDKTAIHIVFCLLILVSNLYKYFLDDILKTVCGVQISFHWVIGYVCRALQVV